MKTIELTKGRIALIDDADYSLVSSYNWRAVLCGAKWWYAVWDTRRNNARPKLYMHRLIIQAARGQMVDHINGNGLDNQRGNLRLCTNSQNQHNSTSTWGSSLHRGVRLDRRTGKWGAAIRIYGKVKWLGTFDDEEEAARIVMAERLKLSGLVTQEFLLPAGLAAGGERDDA